MTSTSKKAQDLPLPDQGGFVDALIPSEKSRTPPPTPDRRTPTPKEIVKDRTLFSFEFDEGYNGCNNCRWSSFDWEEVLGSGSSSEVQKARLKSNGALYAIKKIKKEVKRFRDVSETQRLMDLVKRVAQHENLLKHHCVWIQDSRLYIHTEYCPGGDLSSYFHQWRIRICTRALSLQEQRMSDNSCGPRQSGPSEHPRHEDPSLLQKLIKKPFLGSGRKKQQQQLLQQCLATDSLSRRSLEREPTAEERAFETEIWRVIHDAARGLEQMHAAGLMHLDIKPANLYASQAAAPPTLTDVLFKIGDFGCVHEIQQWKKDVTDEGDCRYLCPEWAHTATTQTDIFALGISAYEILFAQPLPQKGEDWQKLRSGDFSFPVLCSLEQNKAIPGGASTSMGPPPPCLSPTSTSSVPQSPCGSPPQTSSADVLSSTAPTFTSSSAVLGGSQSQLPLADIRTSSTKNKAWGAPPSTSSASGASPPRTNTAFNLMRSHSGDSISNHNSNATSSTSSSANIFTRLPTRSSSRNQSRTTTENPSKDHQIGKENANQNQNINNQNRGRSRDTNGKKPSLITASSINITNNSNSETNKEQDHDQKAVRKSSNNNQNNGTTHSNGSDGSGESYATFSPALQAIIREMMHPEPASRPSASLVVERSKPYVGRDYSGSRPCGISSTLSVNSSSPAFMSPCTSPDPVLGFTSRFTFSPFFQPSSSIQPSPSSSPSVSPALVSRALMPRSVAPGPLTPLTHNGPPFMSSPSKTSSPRQKNDKTSPAKTSPAKTSPGRDDDNDNYPFSRPKGIMSAPTKRTGTHRRLVSEEGSSDPEDNDVVMNPLSVLPMFDQDDEISAQDMSSLSPSAKNNSPHKENMNPGSTSNENNSSPPCSGAGIFNGITHNALGAFPSNNTNTELTGAVVPSSKQFLIPAPKKRSAAVRLDRKLRSMELNSSQAEGNQHQQPATKVTTPTSSASEAGSGNNNEGHNSNIENASGDSSTRAAGGSSLAGSDSAFSSAGARKHKRPGRHEQDQEPGKLSLWPPRVHSGEHVNLRTLAATRASMSVPCSPHFSSLKRSSGYGSSRDILNTNNKGKPNNNGGMPPPLSLFSPCSSPTAQSGIASSFSSTSVPFRARTSDMTSSTAGVLWSISRPPSMSSSSISSYSSPALHSRSSTTQGGEESVHSPFGDDSPRSPLSPGSEPSSPQPAKRKMTFGD